MEAKKIIERVQGINGGQTATGTLTLTDFHMIFSATIEQQPPRDGQEAPPPPKKRERWITYPMLSHCTFRPTPPGSRQAPLDPNPMPRLYLHRLQLHLHRSGPRGL
ncbi:hypothetical protein TrVGV298_006193 [Trichoderma virens]|nr:hypothetical protein TrVGV298_006193 [Trichoderma virens]